MTKEEINKIVSARMACECYVCQRNTKPYRFGACDNVTHGWAVFDRTHNTNMFVKSHKVAS